jgi:hypothetical protein
MQRNNRRYAASQVNTYQTSECSAIAGAELRREEKLTPVDLKRLDLFRCTDGRTSVDVYPVFKCTLLNEKRARIAIETDTPPLLVAEEITGLDKIGSGYWALPAPHGKEWEPHMIPGFDTWLFSSVRYPKYKPYDNKAIRADFNSCRSISCMDRVEIYSSLLQGTITKYMTTNNARYAKTAWQVLCALQETLSKSGTYEEDEKRLPEQEQELKILIEKRDASSQDAVRYKTKISNMHPAQYYRLMYRLMHKHPELVHRSRFPNPATLIWGLLAMGLMPNHQQPDTQQLSNTFLRLFLERGLVKRSLPSKPRVTTRRDLVEWCHDQLDSRLKFSLRTACISWCIALKTYTQGGHIGANAFHSLLQTVKSTVFPLKGVLPFCLVLCPTTTLNDDRLAEIWMTSCENENKSSVLDFAALSCNNTPLIDKMLHDINFEIKIAREEAEALREEHKRAEKKQEFTEEDLEERYQALFRLPKGHHWFSGEHIQEFGRIIYALVADGSLENLPLLQYIETNCNILSRRRLVTLICRLTKQGSPLYRHYSTQGHTQCRYIPPEARNWACQLVWQLKGAQPDFSCINKVDVYEKIQFIPFERAVELVSTVNQSIGLIQDSECRICFEDVSNFVNLHEDRRHRVCNLCAPKLTQCPFCRQELL